MYCQCIVEGVRGTVYGIQCIMFSIIQISEVLKLLKIHVFIVFVLNIRGVQGTLYGM